jgi:cell division cycle protein 37
LQDVISSMHPKEAKYHMKRCVDSGLWVPSDNSIFDGRSDEDNLGEALL